MTDTKSQEAILALLADPATHGGLQPTRVDTHISSVFLVGDYAWKIKKAVTLPFLDFSTPALRRAACEAEMAVNEPWNPSLYLGVVPVTKGPSGKLRLGGQGEEVDTVVSMRRFSPKCQLDTLVHQGEIDRSLLTGLARTLWLGYGKAEIHRDRGGADAMLALIDELAQSFAPFLASVIASEPVMALLEEWRALVAKFRPLLNERRAQGFVRHCHGDLHLGNVCLFDGALNPFDAIEFNEDMAIVDTFYDLAFLLMDLMAHDAQDHASVVMNYYLDLSGDFGALPLLPLFLSLRAGIRAMVKASMGHADDAGHYLSLAADCLKPALPVLVAIGGLSGSGKSRMSRRLAPLLGLPGAAVVRTDAVRKRLMGVGLTEPLSPEGYQRPVTERVYGELMTICRQLVGTGVPVIADGVFARPEERAQVQAIALQAGCDFHGLWLEASFDVAAARIERRQGDASDATPDVRAKQQDMDVGPITWVRVATDRANDGAFKQAKIALGLKK